jgi:signal transduction histidine kinase
MAPDATRLADLFLEQGPACNWIVNRDCVFERVWGNSAALFGRTASELARQPVSAALGPAAQSWCERFHRALEGESLVLRERRGDSTWFVSLFPIRAGDGATFAGGTAREVTSWTTAEQELRYTALGALKAQEHQRRTAARFLHDNVGQNMTALGLQLDLVRMDLESSHPEIHARIGDVQKLLESIMEEVRDYSYELNPSTVERAGLRAALDRLTVRIRERFPGAVRVNVDPSFKIDPALAAAMYHVAEEAVENAVQHAGCSAIEIAVKSTRKGPSLEVRDNGKGFDPADPLRGGRGLGLLTMEHYAAQAGLVLAIRSRRNKGTAVWLGPVDAQESAGGASLPGPFGEGI